MEEENQDTVTEDLEDDEEEFIVSVEREPDLLEWEHKHLIIHTATFWEMRESTGKDFKYCWLMYSFYYAMARRQQTNRPWCNNLYVMKVLGIGKDIFYRCKKLLIAHHHIEQVRVRGKDGKFIKGNIDKDGIHPTYIQVNHMSKGKIDHTPENKEYGSTVLENRSQVLGYSIPLKTLSNTYVAGSDEPQKPPGDSEIVRNIAELCEHFKIPLHERDQWIERHEPQYLLAQLQYTEECISE